MTASHDRRNDHREICRPSRLALLAAAALFLVVAACASEPAEPPAPAAPAAPAVTLPTSYNEVMVTAIDHAAHELWNAVAEDQMPETDEDWTELEHHAWQLVAASTAIRVPGTGVGDATWSESPDWQRLAQEMADTALDATQAIQAHDLDTLSTLGDRLVEVCTECHEVFKPETPSEGIFHPHYR